MLKKRAGLIGLLCMGAFFSVAAGLSVGTVHIPLFYIFEAVAEKLPFFGGFLKGSVSETYRMILFNLRLPRILLAGIVGAGLATAGCCMQGIFRNPMASPYVVGVSSGSSFGAALALLVFPGLFSLPVGAFIFGMASIFIVYRISQKEGKVPIQTLLLTGIAVGFFFSAVTSLLMYMAAESVHRLVFWVMGGFWNTSWWELIIATPFIGFGVPVIFCFARELNILQLGEESASYLGVEVEWTKRICLVTSSLITAAAVSVSGVIGFVGLIIPHITRLLVGPDHRV
ncbi:iron chelate uptake ABC transporter family permease subunit, partial [Candidatus Aerophobetes bacterium]|nr:iron chelate uptake ABC transporter family permease subunit [Candidatus Aerophobetes bacterium]